VVVPNVAFTFVLILRGIFIDVSRHICGTVLLLLSFSFQCNVLQIVVCRFVLMSFDHCLSLIYLRFLIALMISSNFSYRVSRHILGVISYRVSSHILGVISDVILLFRFTYILRVLF